MPKHYFKGSQWRKWDLQVHTFLDSRWVWPAGYPQGDHNLHERENMFNEDLIQHCIDNKIEAIAITDHNSGDAIDGVIQKNESLDSPVTILPGVEVISSEGIHIVAIFNPNATTNRWTNWSITIQNFLTKINMPQPPFNTEGFPTTANCTAKDIIKTVFDYNGMAYFAHANSTNGGIFCKSDSRTRKRVLQLCNIIDAAVEMTAIRNRVTQLSKRLHEHHFDIQHFAIINTSDSRKISDIGSKFTWIKADPTFEGLKQIIYEPMLRVKIQEDNPAESETYAMISALSINFPKDMAIRDESGEKTDFCVNGNYNLEFSNNLTCIIGGRGLGKSTLAHVLYNLWINKDLKKLSEVNSPLVSLEMDPNPLKKIAECTDGDVPSQTEFFFQNEIEYAAKNIESMSTLIGHRLEKLSSVDDAKSLDDLREIWNVSLEKIDELIDAYNHITEIDREISKAQENISTLRKQTEIIKSDKYKKFQSEIKDLSTKISDFNSYKINYEKLIKEIDSLRNTISQLDWNADQGKETLNNLNNTLQDHKEQLQEVYTKFSKDYDTQNFHSELEKVQQNLKNYLETKGLSPENVQELAQANQKIKDLEDHIRVVQLEKNPFEEIYGAKDYTVQSYKSAYDDYKARFLEVSSSLQEKLAGLSISEKEVNFELFVDYTKLKDNLVNFVKASLEDDTNLRGDAIERLLFDDTEIDKYIENKINIRVHLNKSTKAEKHRQIIQELINDDIFLEKFHIRMLKHFHSIDNIQVQTKLGGKLLKNTSFGERCGIVISIVLVAGTNPLVIDQPEDHLDGKFVSDVLVPLLRRQKHNRQIVLITRDANVVVGGDAELIHILDPTDKRTEILVSSIENILYREKYIWILDGGVDAFAKREQKYNIELLSK